MKTKKLKLEILRIVSANERVAAWDVLNESKAAFKWVTESPNSELFAPLAAKLAELRAHLEAKVDEEDTPNVTHQTPEEVLRANGWALNSIDMYYNDAHPKIRVLRVSSSWAIGNWAGSIMDTVSWNPAESTFEDWLMSQVVALSGESVNVIPTPERLLEAQGWELCKIHTTYPYWRKDGVLVFFNGDNWGIRKDVQETTLPKFWDPETQSFAYWLASQVAELTTKPNDALKDELPRLGWVRDPQSGMWSHRNSRCMLTLNDAEEWKIVRQNGHEMVVLDIYAPSQPFFEWLGKYVKADPTAAKKPEPKSETRDENGALSLDSRNDVLKRLGWVMKKGSPFKTQWEFPHLYAQMILETSSSSYKGHSDSNWDTHMPDLNSFLEWAQECTGATKTQLRELAHAMLSAIGEKP